MNLANSVCYVSSPKTKNKLFPLVFVPKKCRRKFHEVCTNLIWGRAGEESERFVQTFWTTNDRFAQTNERFVCMKPSSIFLFIRSINIYNIIPKRFAEAMNKMCIICRDSAVLGHSQKIKRWLVDAPFCPPQKAAAYYTTYFFPRARSMFTFPTAAAAVGQYVLLLDIISARKTTDRTAVV